MSTHHNKDITFTTDSGRFNYRVAAVITHKNKILLLTEDRFDFWYLPGGRAILFETSESALKREVFEELSETLFIERILWITECLYYFTAWDIRHHEIAFYYLAHFSNESPVYSTPAGIGKEEFSNEKTTLSFKWFEINKLDKVHLVPHFLKKALKNIPKHPVHLIIDELNDKI